MANSSCHKCGARLADGADVCDLCGTPVPVEGVAVPDWIDLADEVAPTPTPEGDASGLQARSDALADEPEPATEKGSRKSAVFEKAEFVEPEVSFADVPENDPPRTSGGSSVTKLSGAALEEIQNAVVRQQKKRTQASRRKSDNASSAASSPEEDTATSEVVSSVPATRPSNRNAILVTAAAVLLTVGLFVVNSLSDSDQGITDTPGPQTTAVSPIAPPPLSDEHEQEAQDLKNQIATLSGSRKVSKQRELISLYAQERRFDLAGVVQQELAQALDSEIEWIRSGNYFYDWMETQTGATKTDYARLAIASYQRALDINPDNLDVRTNMALAYLYDPSSPMQAIRNTNLVLEKNPDHVLANFNRGVMLMQINRLDQAIEQFKRVQTLVGDPNDPVYQRAENAIQTIRQHRNQ